MPTIITAELKSYILERDPEKIGLNMSKNIGSADGLTYTAYHELAEILGPDYQSRFVSAEKLVSDFRSRRVASEIAAFAEAGELSYQIAEQAFSNQVITPGITTLEDVAWWMMDQLFEKGLGSSFGMPSVYVTGPEGIEATSTDRIIQRGDVLMIDWGVVQPPHLGWGNRHSRAGDFLSKDKVAGHHGLFYIGGGWKELVNRTPFQDPRPDAFLFRRLGIPILNNTRSDRCGPTPRTFYLHAKTE